MFVTSESQFLLFGSRTWILRRLTLGSYMERQWSQWSLDHHSKANTTLSSWGRPVKKSGLNSYLGSKCSPLSPAVCDIQDIQNIITRPTLEKYTQVIARYLCSVFT